MPVVKEGTPNGEMKDGFKRIIKAFLQATREGIAENVREQELFAQGILDEAEKLEQTAPHQKQATT